MFRDAFAVELLEQGMSLETISMLLRHASIKGHQEALQALGEDAPGQARRGRDEELAQRVFGQTGRAELTSPRDGTKA